MCGRYTYTGTDVAALAARFGFEASAKVEPETLGRFNVCPTETILAVVERDGVREPRALRWGLYPPRAREPGKGPSPINARAETAATNGMFSRLMAQGGSRCLVIADGWYEWLRPEAKGGPRIPFRYTVDGGAPFAFAGLKRADSACILTTQANAVCRPVHERMPCVLAGPEEEAAWLSDSVDAAAAQELLGPLAAQRTSAAPANPAVNKAGVEGPELLVAP